MTSTAPAHRHIHLMPHEPDGPQAGWWCSLTNKHGKFVGVVIIAGHTGVTEMPDLLGELNRVAPDDGGEALLIRYSEDDIRHMPTGRLLRKADLAVLGENDQSCAELGIEL